MEVSQREYSPQASGARPKSSVALKAALNMADLWALTDSQLATLLGGVPVPTLRRWKGQLRDTGSVRTELSRDQLDRVSYLLGIYKGLHILFPNKDQANAWVKKPNDGSPFRGRSALDVMLAGSMSDLQQVRRYLDAWRG